MVNLLSTGPQAATCSTNASPNLLPCGWQGDARYTRSRAKWRRPNASSVAMPRTPPLVCEGGKVHLPLPHRWHQAHLLLPGSVVGGKGDADVVASGEAQKKSTARRIDTQCRSGK